MANTDYFHHFVLDPKFSEDSNTLMCTHPKPDQEFILFILNRSRIPMGHLQETIVFSENWLFYVIYFNQVIFLWKRKLFLSYKDFMFSFSLWNTKPKETQTPVIYINCKIYE